MKRATRHPSPSARRLSRETATRRKTDAFLASMLFVFGIVLTSPAYADFWGVAHRGGRTQAPENTLEVMTLTMALEKTPWLETDSQESSDGVLMLHHDPDMCRTTNIGSMPGYDCNVPGNNPTGDFPVVGDFTLAELKTLDVGSWFSPAYAGTLMPTLEEALNLVDGTGFPLLVEVKSPGQAPIIEEILTRTGIGLENIIIWARQPFAYEEFHSVIPGVRQITGILPLSSVTPAFLADRAAKGDYGIGIQSPGLTQADVDLIHSYGLLIYSLPGVFGGEPLANQIEMGIDAYHVQDELGWATYINNRPCIDREDNDSDSFADWNGIDVDFDGVHEFTPDGGCTGPFEPNEISECEDTVDNDGDTFVDLADPECVSSNSSSESPSSPVCGDTVITPPETCDDGDVLVGDGCYSNCQIEDSLTIHGTADGGSVSVTISGVAVMITTLASETADEVIENLVDAVNADPTLQGMGLSAAEIANTLYTDGTVDSVTISDTGLSTAPLVGPVLSVPSWFILLAGLTGCGLFLSRRPGPTRS